MDEGGSAKSPINMQVAGRQVSPTALMSSKKVDHLKAKRAKERLERLSRAKNIHDCNRRGCREAVS